MDEREMERSLLLLAEHGLQRLAGLSHHRILAVINTTSTTTTTENIFSVGHYIIAVPHGRRHRRRSLQAFILV